MRCHMKVIKDVKASELKGIIVLPPGTGDMVTVTVTEYVPCKKPDKVAMRAAMRRIEQGFVPTPKTLDEFRAERLANV